MLGLSVFIKFFINKIKCVIGGISKFFLGVWGRKVAIGCYLGFIVYLFFWRYLLILFMVVGCRVGRSIFVVLGLIELCLLGFLFCISK